MNNWSAHREVEKVKPPTQVSVASLPKSEQDAAMSSVDEAITRYPSVLVAGHLLHICEIDSEWEVWLNCEDAEFTGLCLAEAGTTRAVVVARAVEVLEAVVAKLQEPA